MYYILSESSLFEGFMPELVGFQTTVILVLDTNSSYNSHFNPECNTERGFIDSLSIALTGALTYALLKASKINLCWPKKANARLSFQKCRNVKEIFQMISTLVKFLFKKKLLSSVLFMKK